MHSETDEAYTGMPTERIQKNSALLDEAIERLAHQLELLSERLSIAMRPGDPKEFSNMAPEAVRNPISTMALELEFRAQKINEYSDAVSEILDRLEL